MWVSIFGNAALDIVRAGGDDFGRVAMNQPEQGFYGLLAEYPATAAIAGIATFVGLLFYVTSADSGALVMANLTSRLKSPEDDASSGVRIFWAITTGLLTMAMLLVGGIDALQNATIIMALPFAFVLILMMIGLHRALQVEGARADAQRHRLSLPAVLDGRSAPGADGSTKRSWRHRLLRALSFPDRSAATSFLTETAQPALDNVAEEMRHRGVRAESRRENDDAGNPCAELVADSGEQHPFRYQLRPHRVPMPVYGRRAPHASDVYYRLEVHLADGGQGYDVMDYTQDQLIDDVLDQYEAHLEFLRTAEVPAE